MRLREEVEQNGDGMSPSKRTRRNSFKNGTERWSWKLEEKIKIILLKLHFSGKNGTKFGKMSKKSISSEKWAKVSNSYIQMESEFWF